MTDPDAPNPFASDPAEEPAPPAPPVPAAPGWGWTPPSAPLDAHGPIEQGPIEQGPIQPGPIEQGPIQPGPIEPGPNEQATISPGRIADATSLEPAGADEPTLPHAPFPMPPGAGWGAGVGAGAGSGGGGGGGAWNYGYGYGGSNWGAPPRLPGPHDPNSGRTARRVLATIAVLLLVLVSGGVGAVISAAVHNNGGSNGATFPGDSAFGDGSAGVDPAALKIASKVTPGIVDVYTTIRTRAGAGEAAGTGMLLTSSGEVLTNNHVIADALTIRVSLANGDSHTAKVVGYDVKHDVALLKVNGVSGLPTVQLGDATQVNPGDSVVAIGNAGGRGGSPAITSGAITALGQQVTAGDASTESSETLHGMIQLSARIEPGDSGGPLVDSHSRVIGMNTAAASNDRFFGQGGSSVAFAIPINTAIAIVHHIEAGEGSKTIHIGDRALLGVKVEAIGDAIDPPTDSGAYIAGVEPSSPAESAGIAAGDVIVSLNGQTITSPSGLTTALSANHPKDKVDVGWIDSSGQRHDASVQLIAGPPN